jgi:hypothetical protein
VVVPEVKHSPLEVAFYDESASILFKMSCLFMGEINNDLAQTCYWSAPLMLTFILEETISKSQDLQLLQSIELQGTVKMISVIRSIFV